MDKKGFIHRKSSSNLWEPFLKQAQIGKYFDIIECVQFKNERKVKYKFRGKWRIQGLSTTDRELS